jgi:protein O-mannosyl-transferase
MRPQPLALSYVSAIDKDMLPIYLFYFLFSLLHAIAEISKIIYSWGISVRSRFGFICGAKESFKTIMIQPIDPSKPTWLRYAPSMIIAICVAFYLNSFAGAFLLDDHRIILGQFTTHHLQSLSNVLRGERPFVGFVNFINISLGGLNRWTYHAFNLIIHILSALTLFGILKRVFQRTHLKHQLGPVALPISFAIALIWAIHPLQTQSVTYITQRYELVCGFFYLFTLYSALKSVDASRWQTLAIVSCLLGMFSKEVMITAPIVILLFDRLFLFDNWKTLLKKRKYLHLGLMATWIPFAFTLLQGNANQFAHSAGFDATSISAFHYALSQTGVLLHYLKLSVWPSSLCFDYLWPEVTSFSEALPSVLLMTPLLIALLVSLKYWPSIGFLGITFLLILAPTSSFYPILDLAVEHRMYLPLACVITLIVTLAYQLLNRVPISKSAKSATSLFLLFIITGLLGSLTFKRNTVYASEISIWQDTVKKRPNNYRAHDSLGNALLRTGKLGEAKTYYLKSLELNPNYVEALVNLGKLLAQEGEHDLAIQRYEQALAIGPNQAEASYNLGRSLYDLGDKSGAKERFEKALSINPHFAEAHNNLGALLYMEGKRLEAIAHYQEALRLRPDYRDAWTNLKRALGG